MAKKYNEFVAFLMADVTKAVSLLHEQNAASEAQGQALLDQYGLTLATAGSVIGERRPTRVSKAEWLAARARALSKLPDRGLLR